MNKRRKGQEVRFHDGCTGLDDEQQIIISTLFDANLMEKDTDYYTLSQSPAYEALMDAYAKYEDDPQNDVWVGESETQSGIVAVLECGYKDNSGEKQRNLSATVYAENTLMKYIAQNQTE